MGKKSHPFHSICHILCPVWFCDRGIFHLCSHLDHCRWAGLG
uniref:Uncharacterized protein n=1 Tax=Pelodiscus sinensis TaxID=13735 RepID=K7EY45_PELSI